MDKKVQKKKDREKEVKKKLLKRRMQARDIKKEAAFQEEFAQKNRIKQKPFRTGDALKDNITILEQQLKEYDDAQQTKKEARQLREELKDADQ